LKEELNRSGCRDWEIRDGAGSVRPVGPTEDGRLLMMHEGGIEVKSKRALEFVPVPSIKTSYCVSYAWNHKSKAFVEKLCDDAARMGIVILRDMNGLGLGESISKFMKRLGAGDRVFVILSDKYFKSAYCMFELFEIWRNSRMEPEEFRRRIRV